MQQKFAQYKQSLQHTKQTMTDTRIVAIDQKCYYSIQMVETKNNWTIKMLSKHYFSWLEDATIKIIKTSFDGQTCIMSLRLLNLPLLVLTCTKSSDEEIVFNVTGGWLSKKKQKGTFSFFSSSPTQFVIALTSFQSPLPWFIYRITQAPFHEVIMKRFQKNMKEK